MNLGLSFPSNKIKYHLIATAIKKDICEDSDIDFYKLHITETLEKRSCQQHHDLFEVCGIAGSTGTAAMVLDARRPASRRAAEIGEEIPGARGGQTGGVPEQPHATTRLT